MTQRYRTRENDNISRSMTHRAVIEKLISSEISQECEIQKIGESWYPISKHPNFRSYFDVSHSNFNELTSLRNEHNRTRKIKDIKRVTQTSVMIIASLLTLAISYVAFQSGFFEIDYDPFVRAQANNAPLPKNLLENLDNEQPELGRQELIIEAENASKTAEPEQLENIIVQLQRHIVQFPQDEDAVYWYLLLRCQSHTGEAPRHEWIDWIDKSTIRVDKLARLFAWYGLKRGYPDEVTEAVKDCDSNDTVCLSAKWILDGDLDVALEQAKLGDAFAWRSLLDIVNDSNNSDYHLLIAEQLKKQWPKSDVPYRLLMDHAIIQQNWSEAYELKEKIKIEDSDTANSILKLALLNQDYAGAMNIKERYDVSDPQNLFLMASASIQIGQYKQAKILLNEAINNGMGVKAHLLLSRAHAGLDQLEESRAIYAQNATRAQSRSEQFYAVYLGAILRNFRTAGQLMVEFPTEEPEYWLLAMHTAIIRQGPQQTLESIEGLAQTDIRILWDRRMENAWVPLIDRAGMAAAAKALVAQLPSSGDAQVLIDWVMQGQNASQSVLALSTASAANSSAKSFAAYESGQYEKAISEADVALKFEANPDWLSTIKAISLLKAGSKSRGSSAMDSILDRSSTRANARLLAMGAEIRKEETLKEELLNKVSIRVPPRYLMMSWPQSLHKRFNEF